MGKSDDTFHPIRSVVVLKNMRQSENWMRSLCCAFFVVSYVSRRYINLFRLCAIRSVCVCALRITMYVDFRYDRRILYAIAARTAPQHFSTWIYKLQSAQCVLHWILLFVACIPLHNIFQSFEHLAFVSRRSLWFCDFCFVEISSLSKHSQNENILSKMYLEMHFKYESIWVLYWRNTPANQCPWFSRCISILLYFINHLGIQYCRNFLFGKV